MRSKKTQKEPFFMIFPWCKVAGMLFFGSLMAMIVYRMSESAGEQINRACLLALFVTGLGGLCGIYPISRAWGKEVYGILIGIMVASTIRLLISGVGVAIITFFTNVHRSWFVLFLGIYYLLFMAIETWLGLWVLRNSQLSNRKPSVHGNFWDFVS
jgi:hypothetical protein